MKRLLAHFIWFTHKHIFISCLIIYTVVATTAHLITGQPYPLVAMGVEFAIAIPIAVSRTIVNWGRDNRC